MKSELDDDGVRILVGDKAGGEAIMLRGDRVWALEYWWAIKRAARRSCCAVIVFGFQLAPFCIRM